MNYTAQIIMPVGSDPAFGEKQAAIAAGARVAGFRVVFPDYDPKRPAFDLEPYIKRLQRASVVLADLTGERPSCYYELGLAEALGLPVALIAESGTEIHQAGMRSRIRYYANVEGLKKLVEEILAEMPADGTADTVKG